MTISHRTRSAVLLFIAALARPAGAGDAAGGVLGWVEDRQGTPVAGAVISLFGRGIRAGGIATLTDSSGRFFLPSLPAGSYTLRALGRDQLQARQQQVTVLPNRDSVFTLSLSAEGVDAAATDESRELRWLLRHKRRSILEDLRPEAVAIAQGGADRRPGRPGSRSDLAGTVQVMATPAVLGLSGDLPGFDGTPSSLSVLRLKGWLAESGEWNLGGLVTESAGTTWRMAAEFVAQPWSGHRLQAGAGYGTRFVRPLVPGYADNHQDNRSAGALFFQDRFQVGDRVAATLGARYSYIGFVENGNHLDTTASVEWRLDRHTRVTGTASRQTLAPGGDLLTLSTLATAPAMAMALMDQGLRAEQLMRYRLAGDTSAGSGSVGTEVFFEKSRDQLVNVFAGSGRSRSLRIGNGSGLAARGLGLSYSRRLGDVVKGSIAYRYGWGVREDGLGGSRADPATGAGRFHDVVARFETFIDRSGTRVTAFYRISTVRAEADASPLNARFDVQLTQGLPFLGNLTRADWEVLVACRNLFYETSEGGVLDEMTIVKPPTRVLGGISVRF